MRSGEKVGSGGDQGKPGGTGILWPISRVDSRGQRSMSLGEEGKARLLRTDFSVPAILAVRGWGQGSDKREGKIHTWHQTF